MTSRPIGFIIFMLLILGVQVFGEDAPAPERTQSSPSVEKSQQQDPQPPEVQQENQTPTSQLPSTGTQTDPAEKPSTEATTAAATTDAAAKKEQDHERNTVGYRTIQAKGRQHKEPIYADGKR